jgi:hypothetical protein
MRFLRRLRDPDPIFLCFVSPSNGLALTRGAAHECVESAGCTRRRRVQRLLCGTFPTSIQFRSLCGYASELGTCFAKPPR